MQNKTIKFFISQTFKDFIKERNALQNFVFPRLKKLCKNKGFSFQPVDLRWGITVQSSEDIKTINPNDLKVKWKDDLEVMRIDA